MSDTEVSEARCLERLVAAKHALAGVLGVPPTSITFSAVDVRGEMRTCWSLPMSSLYAALATTGSNLIEQKPTDEGFSVIPGSER